MFSGPVLRRAAPLALALTLAAPSAALFAQGIKEPHTPVSTARGDIAAIRSSYVDAFNAKNAAAVAALYAPDAVVINPDGSVISGNAAIRKMMADSAANWPHAVVTPDSLRIYGATAVETGTWTTHPASGGEQVSHYLVVLRRYIRGWRIQSLANVAVMGSGKM